MSTEWTHPSVQQLLNESEAADPFDEIVGRARKVALQAMEAGWTGPPFDSFALADYLGVPTVPQESLEDARLVPTEGGSRIEFNPKRRPARLRFSIAHELAHLLFKDHGEMTRYRNESHHEHRRNDDWQLEVLCNVAAAELLMPVGALPPSQATNLRLTHLLDLRAAFGVSTEALLRRVIRLTDLPACMFACARLEDGSFRVDYVVPSRAWREPMRKWTHIPADSALAHCTAVGFSIDKEEFWSGFDVPGRVQAVSVPPFPGDRFPRIIGLLTPPADSVASVEGIHLVRGDATQPHHVGPAIIAHVVNNTARRWGGDGFAQALGQRFSEARDDYENWTGVDHPSLGELHMVQVGSNLWIASMMAQAGYGETTSGRPRLKLGALATCLDKLRDVAQSHNASVHMPAIGTGQGGMHWPPVRDLILEYLVDRDVPVTVYVLEDARMPEENPPMQQLTLA